MEQSVLDPVTGPPAPVSPVPTGDGPVPGPERSDAAVSEIADALSRTMRSMHRLKAHFMARSRETGQDWSAHVLLTRVVADGPQRISALADVTQCDVSTTSRQAAAMVKEGLLERQADPDDGRASLVAATDRGRAAAAEFRARRNREFAQMLSDWSADDLTDLAHLLDRLAGRLHDHETTTSPLAPGAAASREENAS